MANVDNPFGFLPAATISGSPYGVRIYEKDAADTVVLGQGDMVDVDGSLNGVARSAAGAVHAGASLNFGAADTLTDHAVAIATGDVIYVAQEDGVGGAIGTAGEGLNCEIIVADASTTTGRAQSELDSNTAATTLTLDVNLYKVHPGPDNDGTLTNSRWLVFVRDRRFGLGIAGV